MAGLVGFALPPPVEASPTTESFTYVAYDFYVVGPALAAQEIHRATGVGTMPLGYVNFRPSGDTITFSLDDSAVRSGTVPVYVMQQGAREPLFACVPVNATTSISVTPGAYTDLSVMDATYASDCDHGATTGTLTLTY